MSKKKTWITVLILVVVVAAAAVITLYGGKGDVPTWENVYESVGLTEETSEPSAPEMTVHFIDVGQGDCILVQTPDGSMLVDAGDSAHTDEVLDYLRTHGVTELSYVVATHPHADHIGGMSGVLGTLSVRNILMPRLFEANTPTNATYRKFLTAVKESGAKVIAAKPGMSFTVGRAQCTVLAPYTQSEKLNNMSVVLCVDWGERTFLLTGDAEKASEKEILAGDCAEYLSADVLKLGHHGSSSSSSGAFLEAVNPSFAVVSCGADNDYGHPHRETMDKMQKKQIPVLRTDEQGSIRFVTDGRNLRWEADDE